MKEHVSRFIGVVLLTILALLGLGAAIHIMVTLPLAGKGPEWVGAIGTVGTLIGTIWLATKGERNKRKEALLVARLHAAGMFWKLSHLKLTVESVSNNLDPGDAPDLNKKITSCRDILEKLILWSMADLVPLAPLPRGIAAKLAEVADRIHIAKTMLSHISILDIEVQRDSLLDIRTLLETTTLFLDIAVAECKAAAMELRENAPSD